MTLSDRQKKHLRRRGHQLKPVIMIGAAGLTEAVSNECKAALEHHELIKVSVRVGDRAARDAVIDNLCQSHAATLVQRVGSIALLYRPNPQKPPEKRLRIPSS